LSQNEPVDITEEAGDAGEQQEPASYDASQLFGLETAYLQGSAYLGLITAIRLLFCGFPLIRG
jgi:hypothetical protein